MRSAVCGKLSPEALVYGTYTAVGQFPWHVAIYSVPRQYRLICGGTLIAPNVVLSGKLYIRHTEEGFLRTDLLIVIDLNITAAHCFYNESFEYASTKPADYAIVVGKLTRDYALIDDAAQKRLPVCGYELGRKPFTFNIDQHQYFLLCTDI